MRNDRFWKSDLRTFSTPPSPPKKMLHTLLVSQEPVLIWQEGFQFISLVLVSGNSGIFFSFFSRHFLDILRWLVPVFSRGESLHFWTHEIQKTNMAARGFFCASFNTFLWRYFWPVLYKIRIYLKEIKNAQCALLSYISTWEFIFSHFSSVLKNSQVLI